MPDPEKMTDPYAELAVRREATDAEIAAAFRNIAKNNHPDTLARKGLGADELEAAERRLQRACEAAAILRDPERRKRFDETGIIEEEGAAGRRRSAAVEALNAFIEQAIVAYVDSQFAPANDPRRRDLAEEFSLMVAHNISEAQRQIEKWKQAQVFLADMAKRWTGGTPGDVVHRSFEMRQERVAGHIADLTEKIEASKVALDLARTYKFAWDKPQPSSSSPDGPDAIAYGLDPGARGGARPRGASPLFEAAAYAAGLDPMRFRRP